MSSLTIRPLGVASSLVLATLLTSGCDDDGAGAGASGSGDNAGAAGQSTSGNGGNAATSGSGGGAGLDPLKDCGVATAPSVPELALTEVVSGLTRPVYLTQPRGEASRLFVVEKPGTIRIVVDGVLAAEPFLDIEPDVSERYQEMGLLGLAFHPGYATNGRFYVYYSTLQGGMAHISRVSEYSVSSSDPDRADPASARVLLEVNQPEDNHNGGDLEFGPDGFLYIGLGDGGGAGDQHGADGNGQNLETLLGKILRLDVDGRGSGQYSAYAIPSGNLARDGARPEIWSYGLRNPWRYSFDACTGDMYIGDVGQSALEEVDFAPANAGGRNYGWRLMEGDRCYNPEAGCDAAAQNLVLPIATYGREVGQSITGGYVYRGSSIPSLRGTYIYADYSSARFFALRVAAGAVVQAQTDISSNLNTGGDVDAITSFGQDSAGELYVLSFGGSVYRIDAE